MPYYIREIPGHLPQAWKIDDARAIQLGIYDPVEGGPSHFVAESGEGIWDCLKRSTPWFDEGDPFHLTKLGSGEYYPRMARPYSHHPDDVPGHYPNIDSELDLAAQTRGQLETLVAQLQRICRTVHPCAETFSTFGHEIRNVLILACTEVEAQWRGILEANSVLKSRYSTRDYVLLKEAMRLDEYAIVFNEFPWLPSISPFYGWGATGKPTIDLPWYDAYNAVKHNREREFSKGNLISAFQAVSACLILMMAQFGFRGLEHRSSARAFFEFTKLPKWPLSDVYITPYDKAEWSAVSYSFTP